MHARSLALALAVSASSFTAIGVASAVGLTYSGTVEGICPNGEPAVIVTNTGTGDIVYIAKVMQLVTAGSAPVQVIWPDVQLTPVPTFNWELINADTSKKFDSGTLSLSDVCSTGTSLESLTPARVLETRPGQKTVDGLFEGAGVSAAESVTELQVTGRGGVPDDASAVLMNLTAVTPDGPGFFTAYPCGEQRPLASNVNYVAGQVVPNAVLAKVGTNGKVCIYTKAASHIIADVNGYVPDGGSPTSLTPARVLETRPGQKTVDGLFEGAGVSAAESVTELQVTGRGGVPDDASAVLMNLTAVTPDGPGFFTAYPCGEQRPLASNVNYVAGQVVPNAVLAKVGTNGKVCIYTKAASHIIADVNGYVPDGGSPTSLTPARVLETRPGQKTVDGLFEGAGVSAAESVTELQVTGRGGVPDDASAVLMNLTAVTPDGPGFFTAYPCGEQRPLASNVNYVAGQVVPNAVLAKVGTNGKVCIYTKAASHIIADVNGYVA